MLAVTSLLVVVILSLVVTRVGAVALRLTGMSDDTACFQARSALTGAVADLDCRWDHTESESEQSPKDENHD